ncbi:MAG: hypothetical protein H7281_02110 [Bacteriovorax sp.]|nr:hypothetical protein [Bacteriovorax sp.]
MTSAVVFQIQSFLVYALMVFGISKRKKRRIHVPTMITVLTWDVLLILQIELNRGAVEKAVKALINPIILNIHVSLAVSCVVFYVLLIYTGRKLLKGDNTYRLRHRIFGWTAFTLRTLTLITSFFAVAK